MDVQYFFTYSFLFCHPTNHYTRHLNWMCNSHNHEAVKWEILVSGSTHITLRLYNVSFFPHFRWMTKLLVTPSKLLLQTGGVLIGTCVFVAALILILHIKEKVLTNMKWVSCVGGRGIFFQLPWGWMQKSFIKYNGGLYVGTQWFYVNRWVWIFYGRHI